jgi:hypothetical protein
MDQWLLVLLADADPDAAVLCCDSRVMLMDARLNMTMSALWVHCLCGGGSLLAQGAILASEIQRDIRRN